MLMCVLFVVGVLHALAMDCPAYDFWVYVCIREEHTYTYTHSLLCHHISINDFAIVQLTVDLHRARTFNTHNANTTTNRAMCWNGKKGNALTFAVDLKIALQSDDKSENNNHKKNEQRVEQWRFPNGQDSPGWNTWWWEKQWTHTLNARVEKRVEDYVKETKKQTNEQTIIAHIARMQGTWMFWRTQTSIFHKILKKRNSESFKRA